MYLIAATHPCRSTLAITKKTDRRSNSTLHFHNDHLAVGCHSATHTSSSTSQQRTFPFGVAYMLYLGVMGLSQSIPRASGATRTLYHVLPGRPGKGLNRDGCGAQCVQLCSMRAARIIARRSPTLEKSIMEVKPSTGKGRHRARRA
jgi:hypothetical protein